MKIIEDILEPTNGYIISFIRNTVNGWWEIEVGLPKTWVFDENKEIKCEILKENEIGKLIKISPKSNNVVIDDLIKFVEIIIETNQKIVEKEQEFANEMQKMKNVLEDKAKKFYEELDTLKINSFKNLNENFANSLGSNVIVKKNRKPRTPKDKTNTIVVDEKNDIIVKINEENNS